MQPIIKKTALLLSASILSAGVSAGVIFSDNFNNESPTSSVTNYTSFDNWNVFHGSVDLVEAGTNSWFDPLLGDGFFVDLDGSTRSGGKIRTNTAFSFNAGQEYRLTFDLAGNNRNSETDSARSIITTIGDGISGNPYVAETISLAGNTDFTTYSFSFMGNGSSGRIIFNGDVGNLNYRDDNIGLLLDNIVLESIDVAEPETLGLLSLGLLGLAMVRRKRAIL